ncbi:MAG: HAMP domain-containing histidine kinase [Planctomycetes bacterium]|nr:HAMP domain-containing histidine kinase [Planctomycetota bacterium]
MTTPRSSPGVLRERLFLAFGLGSALVLVLAAFASNGDPESAGRAELVSTAARVAEAVKAQWDAGRVLARSVEESGAPLIEWTDGKLPFVEGHELVLEPGPGHEVFDALLSQSELVELTHDDASNALDLVLEALAKTTDRARRAEARLRAVQLALKASQGEVAREQYRLACQELDGTERKGTVSYRLLLAAACLQSLPAAERRTECTELRQLVQAGRIAWTPPAPASPTQEDGSVQALRTLLTEVCPECIPSDFELVRAGESLHAKLGDLPAALGEPPSVRRTGSQFFVWKLSDSGFFQGHFSSVVWAREALRRAIEGSRFLPVGFVVDVDPPASKAQAVREHDSLDGDFGFTVKHEDPEGWIARSATKQKALRAAMLVLALLSAAAGFATFRALRRERTLATLKTDFVANVSHELRTPLASILLLSENLEAGRVKSEADKSRYHTLIRREALRLRRLVDDVLDFSRLERGKPVEVRREALRVDPWLERTCGELSEWAREHALELAIECSPTAAEAEIDPEALRRALLNLLDNARKHSGGTQVELAAAREGSELVLSVRDHGRGIPAHEREHVFEAFARLGGHDAPGTGLGLSIVRAIAREHGGSVKALDPASGPGIVFRMRIPLTEESST